jgi:hypothetical protein
MSNDQPTVFAHDSTAAEGLDSRRALLLGVGTLAAGAILASGRQAQGGPLTPPAGPVTPTGVTLQEINGRIALPSGLAEARIPITPNSPSTISQPGSYYLTADRQGLVITSTDVTLDLNGFSISYVASQPGITINAPRVTIRNGRIRPITVNAGSAIRTTLNSGQLSQVTLDSLDLTTDAYAIDLVPFTNVLINQVTWNCANISPSSGGIRVDRGAVITNCAGFGGGEGIRVGIRSVLHNCKAAVLVGTNFVLGEASVATNCVADGGDHGFFLEASAALESCSAQAHSTTGITANGNARISRCQIGGGQRGIDMSNGGNRVEHCKIGNAEVGIRSNGIDSIISNSLNAALGGLGSGILVQGNGALIDSNYIYVFGRGVRMTQATSNNIVIRNQLVQCVFPIEGGGSAIAPIVTNLATATNPFANISS